MRDKIIDIINDAIHIKEEILHNQIENIIKAAKLIIACYKAKGKVLIFGNGGSAADAQHIAAEFVGRFQKERPGLAAIALNTNTSILTAVSNDYGYEIVFARQVEALGESGDVAIGISTSGKAKNVIMGIKKAREMGLKTICLSGGTGGELSKAAELSFIVPSLVTARIQEAHITIGHIICELVEDELFRVSSK
ncbi:MAG: D-sedoheptulose 7-phosphate isomerase [Candidatus Omnitrophota bacterium]|nr:D-sedoheptulose 7-phosphate isomerase [Candidatus Omnitrophota bacterium]